MRVGFIGLGRMGQGMARNLSANGADLQVLDANPAALQPFKEAGIAVASSLRTLVESTDVIFTSLPGPAQVEAVGLGPGGILDFVREGQVWFDLSTSSRTLALRLNERFAAKGAFMLDAPVSGGPAGAASGEMVIWAGGDRSAFDRCRDTLELFSSEARHVGPIGAGCVVKLAHNVFGYTIQLAQIEVFSMATKAGVDPLDLWEALRLGVVGKQSPLDLMVKQVLPGIYNQPAFALALARKDVVLATEMARELDVPMRLANMTLEEMTEAVSRGMGDMDSRSYLQLQLERAGVCIAVSPERIDAAVERQRHTGA
ncbi:NAD(P)-dependent oxidoreductase [Salipiger sp.]|uniref:NAD(P)-dependent oxidoreductase n=1 Tax=Salipiger sp. TaxID=2078585 RepID=UPI003A970737